MAISRELEIAVDLWIKGDMDDANHAMRTAALYYDMTDKEFRKKYEE